MIKRTLAATLLATVALTPLLAAAQEADIRNQSVQDRPRPDYDALGIRRGVFLIYPQVDAGLTYDSNIFADDSDEEDLILSVAPSVTAQSQWSRHEIEATLDAEGAAYVDHNDANYLDVGGRVAGRFDISRASFARGIVEAGREHEDFASPDEVNRNETTNVFRYLVGADYRRTFNRVYVQPGFRVQRIDFEDGDVNFRDRTRYLAALRAAYALSARLRLLAVGEYDIVRYDEQLVLDRDNMGIAGRVGVEAELSGLLFGELTAGFVHRTYSDDDLDDVNGPSVVGALTYNVTPLTSITATAAAAVEETTVVFEDDAASSQRSTSATVEVFHELRRNILLSGEAGYIRDDFTGTGRTDDTYALGVGAEYFLNRNLSLFGNYRFSSRSSDADDAEYDRNVVFVGVNARL